MLPWTEGSRRSAVVLLLSLVFSVTALSPAQAATVESEETVSEQTAASADQYPLSAHEEEELSRFREPSPRTFTLDPKLDPRGLIPRSLLEKAIAYFDENKSLLANNRYLAVIDFAAHSSKPRLFILDMESGHVSAYHVAHGKGSDRKDSGYAGKFSNTPDSKMSSLGFYRTAETYYGAHGRSLRLDGLSSSNSNARRRAIVVHGADYVHERDKKPGRSFGCPAVSMSVRDEVVAALKGGALIYGALSR